MLRYSLKPSREPVGTLSPEEDFKLRKAFGCAAEQRYRADGIRTVSIHYEKGRWFLCDCRPDAKRPPTLFPTISGHIQREDMGDGTPHADECVFARDEQEQRALIETYRQRPKNDRQFTLLRGFSDPEKQSVGQSLFVSSYDKRPSLATVLYELLHEAMLDRLLAGMPLHGGKPERIKADAHLMQAAQSFFLAPQRPIADWLVAGLKGFSDLQNRLKQKQAGWSRPHGLLIDVFDTVEDKRLHLKSGELLATVNGPFPVFGEKEAKLRPPYLVIGLLAQPRRDSNQVELLKAYAHPCVGWDQLMLVDSNLERETLDLLIECRDWVEKKHRIRFAIHKPIFDANPNRTDTAQEICKPDFILRLQDTTVRHPVIVIETMGYNTHAYRERKQRMRPLFERLGKGPHPAPVIEHDRFKPGMKEPEIDRLFKRDVCAAILKQRL